MAAAAGPLEQAGDPLGAANLQHLLHRPKIDAQIEARRRHHTFERSAAQPLLSLQAEVAIDGAVVEGDESLPIGAGLGNRIMPAFCLRTRVGEDE